MRKVFFTQSFLFGIILFVVSGAAFADASHHSIINLDDLFYSPATFGSLTDIGSGGGYSSDIQRVAPYRCYNVRVVDHKCEQTLNGGEALSYDQLLNALGIPRPKKTTHPQSPYGASHYLTKIEENEYSLSFNVAYAFRKKTTLELDGYGLSALTEEGRRIYDNGNNPNFGKLCGDCYFTSFTEGAMVVVSLTINFDSREEKQRFNSYSGGSSWFSSSSRRVIDIIERNNIKGGVSIKVYQEGGNKKVLDIFKKNSQGGYYLLNCDIRNPQACDDFAKTVLDYAANDFFKQIDCDTSRGLQPTGTGFECEVPDGVGLIMPETSVTWAISYARDQLAEHYAQHVRYKDELSKFGRSFAGKQLLVDKIEYNLGILKPAIIECQQRPGECEDIRDDVLRELEPVEPRALKEAGLQP